MSDYAQRNAALVPAWNYAENDDWIGAVRVALARERGYDHMWSGNWETAVAVSPESLGHWSIRASRVSSYGSRSFLLVRDGAIVQIERVQTRVSCLVVAARAEIAHEVGELLRKHFPSIQPAPEQLITTFWYQTSKGPRADARVLAAPTWQEIAGNYSREVRTHMARLLDPTFAPGAGGKLLLFYGPPGTGKTYLLRSLVWEWRDWCATSYVTDVEAWFQDAGYMMSTLLHEPELRSRASSDDKPARTREPWHLLVLEDCAELLAGDAAIRSGQGFSRLLNATDGFLGQGLRVLLLLTTNEEVGRLHPAVSRPGRCAARIEFGPLDEETARRWLRAHGIDAPTDARTLAELYAAAQGRTVADSRARGVGFRTRPTPASP